MAKISIFGQLLAHFTSTIPRSQFSIVIRPWSCNLGNFGGIFFESEAYPHTLSCTGTMKVGHPFISHLVSYFPVLLFPSAPFDEISTVVKAIYFFHCFLYPRTVWNMKCGVSKKSYPFVQSQSFPSGVSWQVDVNKSIYIFIIYSTKYRVSGWSMMNA